MRKLFKTLAIVWCVMYLIGTVCFFSIGNFIYSFALLRESVFSRENVIAFFTGTEPDSAQYSGTEEQEKTWIEIHSEEKYILSQDGLSLHGYFTNNPLSQSRYAIVCH